MIERNNNDKYNSKIRAKLLAWLDANSIISSGVTTETNSAAILAELQLKANPTEDQYSLLRYLELGVATTVADNAPLPVKLSSAAGDINITAGDLNVQLSHLGVNFDSTRIGDGTNLLAINTDGSLNINTSNISVLDKYAISRDDTSTSDEYYGFIDILGNWYIMKIDTILGEYTYVNGGSAFLINWGNRVTLVYDEFNNLTW